MKRGDHKTMQTRTVARWGRRAILVAGLLTLIFASLTGVAWASPSITVDPPSGPGGTQVTVSGSGFPVTGGACTFVTLSFFDANGVKTVLGNASLDSDGSFQHSDSIPSNAAAGTATIIAQTWHLNLLHHCVQSLLGASTSFTVTSQLLGNPGFENGSGSPAPWVTTASINNTSAEPPHSGSWDAWLGGIGTTHADSLYQDVAIPAGITSASLTLWLHIDTADTGSTRHDVLKLQIRNTSNAVLATLATYSNLNAASGYVQRSFDLTSNAGQTIRVFLQSKEDASLQTSFVVDDFALTTS
jgi:hypothetical protein